MTDFEHVHPPVPAKSQFQIKVEKEKKRKTNILDDSAKKPSRSFGLSFVTHAVLLIVLLCIGFKQPEVIEPVVIEMSMMSSEDEISLEPLVGINFDDFTNVDAGELKETELPESFLEPDFSPPPMNPIRDLVFRQENQAGTTLLSDVNPASLLTNLAPERMGVNNDSMRVGNPLMSRASGVGTGGQGLAGDLARLAGYGAKKGLVTVSLIWNTRDDRDRHLVRSNRLPRLGTYNNPDMIYYANKQNGWGHLDIDMNVFPNTDKPVENIYMSHLEPGRFGVYVHYFRSHTRMPSVKFRVIIQRVGEDEPRVINSTVSLPQHNNSSKKVAEFRIP
ncbi:MAG: hypothetical protein ACR2NF_02730 [Pirellulales bacterium]